MGKDTVGTEDDLISPLFFTGLRRCQALRRGVDGSRLKQDMAYSGLNFVIGVGLAIASGVVAGVIIGWYRRLAMVFEPFLTALYSTPRVALVPLVLIWFGIGMWSKVFIVFINAFFPVLINTIGGVKAIDADLLRAARAFCASDWQIFTTVVIPGPFRSSDRCTTGCRVGTHRRRWARCSGQRGDRLHGQYGGQTFQTDTVFLGVVIIALAGIVLTWLAEQWRSTSPAGARNGTRGIGIRDSGFES